MTDLVTLTVSHDYGADPERVFDAWLDPAMAGRFLFATPGGTMVKVEIDAVVGGAFLFVDRRNGEDVEHVGRYLEIDRPRRLVMEFGVPAYSTDMSRVEVTITAGAGGGCRLTLTATVLPDFREQSVKGWSTILAALETVLT